MTGSVVAFGLNLRHAWRFTTGFKFRLNLLLVWLMLFSTHSETQTAIVRIVSGTIVTSQNEVVLGASLTVCYPSGEQKGTSDEDGKFRFTVPGKRLTLSIEGQYIIAQKRTISRPGRKPSYRD